MVSKPLSRRAPWVGAACALPVWSIRTCFILVSRARAARTPTPFDIACLRLPFSALALPPVVVLCRSAPGAALIPAEGTPAVLEPAA